VKSSSLDSERDVLRIYPRRLDLYFGTGRKPFLLPFSGGGGSDTLYSTEIGRNTK
jgi:hypothetical protein